MLIYSHSYVIALKLSNSINGSSQTQVREMSWKVLIELISNAARQFEMNKILQKVQNH